MSRLAGSGATPAQPRFTRIQETPSCETRLYPVLGVSRLCPTNTPSSSRPIAMGSDGRGVSLIPPPGAGVRGEVDGVVGDVEGVPGGGVVAVGAVVLVG